LALVLNRFQRHDTPGRAIAAHFCRPELLSNEPNRKGPLNRPENFELHAHKSYTLEGFSVNSWVRCKTGRIERAGEGQPIVLVEQDINTLAERLGEERFTPESIERFHRAAAAELGQILTLYFPEA
jgi:hypothetical protein